MQSDQFEQFLQQQQAWLSELEQTAVLISFLELFDLAGFYIVNQSDQVVYWSSGMVELTGFNRDTIIGKSCLPDFVVCTDAAANAEALPFTNADNQVVFVTRQVKPLYNRVGGVMGAMVLLTPEVSKMPSLAIPELKGKHSQNFHGIISRSPAMQAVFHIIQNAAETAVTVLVRGESGAGKELVARAIHLLSARRNAPFLAINCAALSSNLLESELFGHVRGAFTGAVKDHHGLFQRAQGGTLFLDEVAELPLELQAKLLRVLQERNFIPVGGDHTLSADVRIVAATHRSLREEVKVGRFREDLMYRLRVVPIFIPPLRERREDISLLIWYFIRQHNTENGRKIDKIDPAAMRVLLDYQWPGNIRELHNVVEYAFAVGRGSTLRLLELPPEFREATAVESVPVPKKGPHPVSKINEKEAIAQALLHNQGKVGAAAQTLGMSRATFWRKRKLYAV